MNCIEVEILEICRTIKGIILAASACPPRPAYLRTLSWRTVEVRSFLWMAGDGTNAIFL